MLFTPGPVDLTPGIRKAQAGTMISHRSPEYRKLHAGLVEKAKKLFGSSDAFLLTGSGTAGLEACVASCVRDGEKVLAPSNGVFGERLREICKIHGAKIAEKDFDYGRGIGLKRIKSAIDSEKPDVVAMVFNDTSTGACNRVREICGYAREKGIFTIVDGVSAIGGHEFHLERFGAGICVTASQKCLGAPPGLALVGAGSEALERIRKATPRSFYLDLARYAKFNEKNETPFTPAVSIACSLDVALDLAFGEGLKTRIARHRKAGEIARRILAEGGFRLFAEKGFESNTVTSFSVSSPDEAEGIRAGLRKKGIEIAGGMGTMKGRLLRVGHMGNFRIRDLEKCAEEIVALKG